MTASILSEDIVEFMSIAATLNISVPGDASEKRKFRDRASLRKWKAEIPYELQMEAGYLLYDFDIILDLDMHPDGELNGDDVMFLCCGIKSRGGLPVVPPIGVAVPTDYPALLINFKEMDVSAYDDTDFLRAVKSKLREKLVVLDAEKGCSLTGVLNAWKQSVIAAQRQSGSKG